MKAGVGLKLLGERYPSSGASMYYSLVRVDNVHDQSDINGIILDG